MEENKLTRQRVIARVKAYFTQRFLRTTLTFIVFLTALAGFGLSYGMRKRGMDAMWLRYPIAVLGAYALFIVLVRVWVELQRPHVDIEQLPESGIEEEEPATSGNLPRGPSWLDWLNWAPDLPGGDGCLIVLVGGLIVSAVALSLEWSPRVLDCSPRYWSISC